MLHSGSIKFSTALGAITEKIRKEHNIYTVHAQSIFLTRNELGNSKKPTQNHIELVNIYFDSNIFFECQCTCVYNTSSINVNNF